MENTGKLSRVDIQVSIMTAAMVVVSCLLIFFLNYRTTYRSMIEDLQNRATNIHDYVETCLDTETFERLNTMEDASTALYRAAHDQLANIRGATGVRYLYTAKLNDRGEFIYLVDGLPEGSGDFRDVGDLIEPECIPDLQRAMTGEVVLPQSINSTTWGHVFISYFPMHADGKVVGALGMEFDAEMQYGAYLRMAVTTPLVILLFCLLASGAAFVLFKRISNPTYRDLANTDFLTGFKNRNSFEVDIHNLDRNADRSGVALFSADLDGLKTVNDTLGHGAGDDYIRRGGRLLQELAGPEGVLYRIGGDEFVVVLRGWEEAALEELLGRLLKAAGEENRQGPVPFSISAGYARFDPAQDGSLFDTLRRSDAQMYLRKRLRRVQRTF